MRMVVMILALAWAGTGPASAQEPPGAMFLGQWDADSDGRVTPDEARRHRADLFEMFDRDSDGRLSAAEREGMVDFRNQMRQAHGAGTGRGPGMEGGRGLADPGRLDADGDGAVSRDEFLQGSGEWFSRRDRDGDGVLTMRDFGGGRRGATVPGG